MFGRLITPLKAHFDFSPRPDEQGHNRSVSMEEEENLTAESFARDVLIEIMRNSVDSLKEAQGIDAKVEMMGELHRVMLEDSCTKDVFRELDGYLLLVNFLSILHTELEVKTQVPLDDLLNKINEGQRLAFVILGESMKDHPVNRSYFESSVSYDALADSLHSLIQDSRTVDWTYGCLLSLALNNFEFSSTFSELRLENSTSITDVKPNLGLIRHVEAFSLLTKLLPEGDSFLDTVCWGLVEHLVTHNHRNQCLLGNQGLVKLLLQRIFPVSHLDQDGPGSSSLQQKILKRLLNMGVESADARYLFQRAVKPDGKLDSDVLEVIKSAMKAKWPEHFSFEGPSSLSIRDTNARGLPNGGFSLMFWIWVQRMPTGNGASQVVWKVEGQSRVFLQLSIRQDGLLELLSAGNKEPQVLDKAKISKARWTHVAFLHHPHRASNPTIRFFIDGILVDVRNWQYPRPDSLPQTMTYTFGDNSKSASASYCIASAYLISKPLPDDLLCLIHHLGPRYSANFQARDLARFLTYDAATSLNIFFASISRRGITSELSPLMRSIKEGIDVNEDSFVFSLNPIGYDSQQRVVANGVRNPNCSGAELNGDIVIVKPQALDAALWKLGGASITLRLVELASTPHELSRSVSILTDGLRVSWQNSEDMERLQGYDTLANILRQKAQLINMTTYEVLFEFIGINFRSPEQSTIVNSLAYRAIALDFEIWTASPKEIQQVHLQHFSIVLEISKYKRFNARQRLAKYGTVRKILFVLQTDWYSEDILPELIKALAVVCQACLTQDEAIKPVVSYLAANIHEATEEASVISPQTTTSRMDWVHSRARAEMVLAALVKILVIPTSFTKFTAALPLTRICLLLLGEHPSSVTAAQVLEIIALALRMSSSFGRKFELVSGWLVLKEVLPPAWDSIVHKVAFDILLGRPEKHDGRKEPTVSCHLIMPSILSSLHFGLQKITDPSNEGNHSMEDVAHASFLTTIETLLEDLIELQSTSASFRQLFKSQALTLQVLDAQSVLIKSANPASLKPDTIRLMEKMNHFLLSFSLDNVVAASQKRRLVELTQQSESILCGDATAPASPTAQDDGTKPRPSIGLLRDRAYTKIISRTNSWREAIIASERKRRRKTWLDLREHRRQVDHADSWRDLLHHERGIWRVEAAIRAWSLDESEGPCRVRKKLEPPLGLYNTSKVTQDMTRYVTEDDMDTQSIIQTEAPPWAEGYEFTIIENENDPQWVDEVLEDKHRRIRHELEPGDVIEAVFTVTRIVGVDSSPGLMILGRKYLYMLDGLVENDEGEVVDAIDAPRNVLSVPGTMPELDGRQRAQRWSFENINTFSKRTCLFRDVALEIYFKDSRSLLVVFASRKSRQDFSDKLTSSVSHHIHGPPRSPLVLKTPLLGMVGSRVLNGFKDEIGTAQRKWQAREISNFTYLSIINQSSGRTPGDMTQYPVFPWVLADYQSEKLDLQSSETFRDLSRPMGALTDPRREAARSRYSNLESVGEIPFHYGTHFSSSMITCHFLIRLEPFTHMFRTLQGGDWDLPDRLFVDVSRSFYSAAEDLRGDVRELIPEFFTCPEFLENAAHLDFGVQQKTGERINHVKLPPWAKQDPLLFITEHRSALESDFVSERLPAWIDLIWGCKQRDPESLNAFHPLSYEGAIDLDSIEDELEKQATVGIIHNFGQTPRKIFHSPHPPRLLHGKTTLPLGALHGIEEDYHLLLQSNRPVAESGVPVAELALDTISERVIPCPGNTLYVPQRLHEQIGWGYVDQSLRLFVDRKLIQVSEWIHCRCAAFADSDHFVTGSTDSTVRLWQLERKDYTPSMRQSHIMRSHTGPVTCVAACRAWSLVVSGSEDGTAIIWDLNRAAYVRSIRHGRREDTPAYEIEAVNLVAINESTGYIATCSRSKLCLHTINARPIAVLDLSASHYPLGGGGITSLAFHEREYSRLGVLATGTAQGTIILRTWSADDTPAGEKAQWKFVDLRALRCREAVDGRLPQVTALRFVGESLYHGDEMGRVYFWDLPE